MARIRTIKPDFFRHESLQDLEIANAGKYPMMVFAGLWGHCDNRGRFEWRPRQLKLDILPFLNFDMAETLDILRKAGMIRYYIVEGREYGEIKSFEKHQRISGKEITDGEKYPSPTSEATEKHQRSIRDQQESQEGKGREEEGNGVQEGNGVGAVFTAASPPADPILKKPAKKAASLPADFYPNDTGIAYAIQRNVSLDIEFYSFRNWHQAKGTTMKDWQAAWRTWCDKAVEFGRAGVVANGARASPRDIREAEGRRVIEVLTGAKNANRIEERDITGEAVRVA